MFRSMTWADVNQHYQAIALNFLRLVDLLLTIPATSAEAERGLSSMELIKNKLRSRLQEKNLYNILRIVMLSTSEDEHQLLISGYRAVPEEIKLKPHLLVLATKQSQMKMMTVM